MAERPREPDPNELQRRWTELQRRWREDRDEQALRQADALVVETQRERAIARLTGERLPPTFDVEGLVNDACARVSLANRRGTRIEDLSAYFWKILRNLINTEYKRMYHERSSTEKLRDEAVRAFGPSSLEDQVLAKLKLAAIEKHLDRKHAPLEKRAWWLHHDGWPYRLIREKLRDENGMDVPEATLRSWIYRIGIDLRAVFGAQDEAEQPNEATKDPEVEHDEGEGEPDPGG